MKAKSELEISDAEEVEDMRRLGAQPVWTVVAFVTDKLINTLLKVWYTPTLMQIL